MKTFAYLLDDQTSPPELWEVLGVSEFGIVTLKNCLDPCFRVLVTSEEIWEVTSF